ncbi:unnamed protein product [Trifolium pratense]|uniref:Uncharacterized protein n=1 Tax=Trifolium pratense TaxID=57577 RepID=A0ACB0L3M8_TRIPR|nr:unnamed protein product [Trifolium pratense]
MCQELLRHFWSSYPVTTQSLVNKARRLKDVISQIDTKLEEIKVSAQSDLRHQVSLVVHPKHQALEAALVHYGAEIRKEMLKGQSQMVMFRRMWILHNWNDEQCVKLLKNCYKAIPNDGKVIVVESILPILPDNTIISKTCSQIDLNMMVYHEGGKERTKNEFIELALKSGFSGIKFAICVSGMWVMEFFK